MYMLKTCSYKKNQTSNIPSSGDTIDVAIEYSPLSLYTYDDTLGGFNYDIIRKIATDHNLYLKFHPIVSLTDATSKLEKGLYDILIAEFPLTSEFNNKYLNDFENAGMIATGINEKQQLVEIVEIPTHRWFIGVQFHPEYKSTVMKHHPLFAAFIKAAMDYKAEK